MDVLYKRMLNLVDELENSNAHDVLLVKKLMEEDSNEDQADQIDQVVFASAITWNKNLELINKTIHSIYENNAVSLELNARVNYILERIKKLKANRLVTLSLKAQTTRPFLK